MGMLDSDSEELKRQNERSDGGTSPTGSGRKVNQSGLGALKHLSKINSLTAKHRAQSATTPAVEHSQKRGTFISDNSQTDSKQILNGDDSVPSVPSADAANSDSKQVQIIGKTGSPVANEVQSVVQNDGSQTGSKHSSIGFSSASIMNVRTEDSVTQVEKQASISGTESAQERLSEVALGDNISSELNQDASKSGSNRAQPSFDSSADHKNEPSAILKSQDPSSSLNTDISGDKSGSKQIQNGLDSAQSEVDSAEVQSGSNQIQFGGKSGGSVVRSSGGKCVKSETKQIQNRFNSGSPQPIHGVSGRLNSAQLNGCKSDTNRIQVIAENGIDPSVRIYSDVRHQAKTYVGEPESILALAGSQKVVLDLIFKLCVFNNSMVCPPTSKIQIASETGLSELTVKTALRRLSEKFYLQIFEFKRGRSGWTKFQIAEKSYKELIHIRGVGEYVTAPVVKTAKVPAIVPPQELPRVTWFRSLDFSKVSPISPMQVNSSIRDLVQAKLDPEMVQEFINRFTSWLATQGRVSSPIGMFCDKLKELAVEGDSAVFLAVTDEERAAQQAYLEKVERLRAENELVEKARAQDAQQKLDTKFAEWYQQASKDEQESLCKPSLIAPFGTDNYKSVLKLAFGEKLSSEA